MNNQKIDVLAVMAEDADFIDNMGESGDDLRAARAAVAELIEAVRTFVEWLDREESGSGVGHLRDSSPEYDTAWREWYQENLRLCDLAQSLGRAALARIGGSA